MSLTVGFFFQILIPLATANHFSLVVVLHTRKKYLIDSVPGLHKDEALMVLGRLEAHLLAEHSFDISEYEVNSPEVLPQDNSRDCGFHVLLYIKGFELMDIHGITTVKIEPCAFQFFSIQILEQ
jgi:Ulp1 family protease